MMEPVAWMDDGTTRTGSKTTGFRVVHADTKATMPGASSVNFTVPLVRLSDAEARIEELEATIKQMKADHACEVTDMATRFRAVNVERLSEQLGADIFALRDRTEAAEALLKEAREALEPFADKLAEIEPDAFDVHMCLARPVADMRDEELALLTVAIGHLRAARAIHHKIGVKDE